MNYYISRSEKLKKKISETADAILILSDINRRYFTGFPSSAGIYILTQKGEYLLLDFRYFEKAKLEQKLGKISENINIIQITKKNDDHIADILKKDNIKTLMYEDFELTCSQFSSLSQKLSVYTQLVPANDIVYKIRASKDEREIELIKSAQKITDDAFLHILSYIKRGVSERDIALELEYFMKKAGADDLAFETICVSGKKSSQPHGTPNGTLIDYGFLTLDFGAKYGGYCSDMTRTVSVGEPSEEMIKVYNTVYEAQNSAFAQIKSGVFGYIVDKAARDVIYNAGYTGCFGHGTGHSLGLNIHESPNFSPSEKEKIPSGAVLSVEPGIYIENKFGVRIEDLVIVTDYGFENITKSPKELIVL